jgi:hypothetical protein
MLNQKILGAIATRNEAVVKKQFEKLGYLVRRLDRNAKGKRPDFLISRADGPEMLCEVKTVHSAGYLPDRDAHISMLDEKLHNAGVLENQIDLTRISDNLANAVRKRIALVKDHPNFAGLPLLVAFFFDFFADHLVCYPRSFNPEVSGILTIEKDIARTKAFEKLSEEQQEQILRTQNAAGLPPESKKFALVRNKAASRPVPTDFQYQCLTR